MNYATGESIKLGDRVNLRNDFGGIVVCMIDSGEYSMAYPEAQWSYLKKGVLISFPMYGLIHYEETVEPSVRLIARSPIEKS